MLGLFPSPHCCPWSSCPMGISSLSRSLQCQAWGCEGVKLGHAGTRVCALPLSTLRFLPFEHCAAVVDVGRKARVCCSSCWEAPACLGCGVSSSGASTAASYFCLLGDSVSSSVRGSASGPAAVSCCVPQFIGATAQLCFPTGGGQRSGGPLPISHPFF